ncbi:MAG: 16S rRNA (cytosine(967)-C(5))-methyltransferase RsmB, partial [Clostridia bacterium]|nr:16S rRNA (cytosine(967)-C(5))-methyltransferase RsmB [Clostridia bacterium]
MEDKINIRKTALSVLCRIESVGQYSNIALDSAIERAGLKGQDRAFLTVLIYGVIERKITLDHIINGLSSIPPSKIESDTRNALRLGLYQLAYLDKIPDHAAINESVLLVNRRSKGFVNAILRSFVRNGKNIVLPDAEKDFSEYLSVKYSVSRELCDRFCRDMGNARAESVIAAMNESPFITIRVNTLKISREEMLKKLSDAGIDARETKYSKSGIRLCKRVAYSDIPGSGSGLFIVQDEASQICAEVLDARSGETLIDACACPGGKSFSSAMLMQNEGRICSFDLHESKLSLIEKGAERLGISIIETAEKDGRVFDETLSEIADRVLCDIPCSGLGVIAKKPDIRYKSLSDIERLPDIQLAIALNCIKYIKNGGVMVYSSCTLLPAENEENVKRIIECSGDVELMPFKVGGREIKDGMLTLYPDTDGTDGFFIA